MAKRVRLPDSKDQDESDLRILLEKFISKSEELEKRESDVLKQVELVQSAVASLQAWQQSAKPGTSAPSSHSLHVDVKQIEAETQEIREETERIQREVRQKIEENKRLQDEVDRRKALQTGHVDEFVTDSFLRSLGDQERFNRMERKEIESRTAKDATRPELAYDAGIHFFNEKLEKLKHLEMKVKKELEEEAEEARKKKSVLAKKIELLERESHADRRGRATTNVKKRPANRK